MTDTCVEHMPKDATMKRTNPHGQVCFYKVENDVLYRWYENIDKYWRESAYEPSDMEDFIGRGVIVRL